MATRTSHLQGKAGGVPYLAVPPRDPDRAPVVVAWHLMDPPRTEAAFAAALPLEGLNAWRIYLGLPMSGSRLPAGGVEELAQLGYEDAVQRLHGPVITQAIEEFGAAWPELRATLDLGDVPVAVVGGSVGAAVAASVLVESDLSISAAVLVSPLLQLRAAVDSMAAQFGLSYPWSDRSAAIARRFDFVARAPEIVAHGQPAVLLVVGEDDDVDGFRKPAEELHRRLEATYADRTRVELMVVPNMAHALAAEPGIEPAPQTSQARTVDRRAVGWLEDHLMGARP
jgi:pimeloyl-ACP methyl ester carboxylesterase